MKYLVVFITVFSPLWFAGCGESAPDYISGEWASTRQNDQYLLVYLESGNYVVKHDPDSRKPGNEETFIGVELEGTRLKLDNGTYLTYLPEEDRLLMGGQSFLKLRPLADEMDKSFAVGPRVETIREIYGNVQGRRHGMKRKKMDCMVYHYYQPEQVTMAKKEIYHDHGGTSWEYYYENGELVFIFIQSFHDGGVFSNAGQKDEHRIYFQNRQPLKYKHNDEFLPMSKLPQWEPYVSSFVEYFSNPGRHPDMCAL